MNNENKSTYSSVDENVKRRQTTKCHAHEQWFIPARMLRACGKSTFHTIAKYLYDVSYSAQKRKHFH